MNSSDLHSIAQLHNLYVEAYHADRVPLTIDELTNQASQSNISSTSTSTSSSSSNKRYIARFTVNHDTLIITITDALTSLYEISLSPTSLNQFKSAFRIKTQLSNFMNHMNTSLINSSINTPAIIVNRSSTQRSPMLSISFILPVDKFQMTAPLELKRIAFMPTSINQHMTSQSSNYRKRRIIETIGDSVDEHGFPLLDDELDENDNDVNLFIQSVHDITFGLYDSLKSSKPSSSNKPSNDDTSTSSVISNDVAVAREAERRLKEELIQANARITSLQSQLDARSVVDDHHDDHVDPHTAGATKKKLTTSNRSAINPLQRRRQKKGFVIGATQ